MQKRLKNKLKKIVLLFLTLISFLLWLKIKLIIFDKNNFPDEIDNFTVGWLMNSGKVLYRDIFVHHFPFMYFLSSFIEKFSHQFLAYRYFMFIYSLLFWLVMILILQKEVKIATILALPITAWSLIFFGGQQFTSETFFAYSLLGTYLLFINKILYQKIFDFSKYELLLISWFLITTIFSSIIYLLSFIPFFAIYLWKNNSQFSKNEIKKITYYFLLPILIFTISIILYFASRKALSDAYWNLFVFNSQFYSLRYHLYQPSDFLRKIFADYFNHFYQLTKASISTTIIYLQSLKGVFLRFLSDKNSDAFLKNLFIIHREFYHHLFSFEFFIALFIILGLVTFIKRKKLLCLLLTVIFTLGARLRYGEMFYLASFYLLGFWLFAFFLTFSFIRLKKKKFLNFVLSLTILLLYYFKMKPAFKFATSFVMQDEHPQLTEFVKKNTDENDQIFQIDVGSSVYYLTQRRPANRFIFYYPWINWTSSLRKEALESIKKKEPKLILVKNQSIKRYPQMITVIQKAINN